VVVACRQAKVATRSKTVRRQRERVGQKKGNGDA
jgi:hypothetical protein